MLLNGVAPACEDANDMWSAGCQSLVASLRVKGCARRALMLGIRERPVGMGSVPFWGMPVSQSINQSSSKYQYHQILESLLS